MFNIQKQKLVVFIALGLVLIIALSIGIAAILKPKKAPVSAEYITVTIDDTVAATFTLDKFDYSVIKAETVNKADGFLISGIDNRISFPQAMNSFIKAMLDAKKITTDETGVMLFAVESRNQDDFEKLANYFRDALKENNCKSRIYTLYFKVKENSVSEYAQQKDVSYAKAYLCKKIERETSLNANELIALSVTEIVEKVNNAAKDDLLSKIESETIEEQKKEEIKDNPSVPVSSGNISSEDSSNENSSSESTSSNDTSSGNISSGDTSSGNTSSGNTSSGNTSSGDTSSGNTSSGDTSSGDTSSNVFTEETDSSGWIDVY